MDNSATTQKKQESQLSHDALSQLESCQVLHKFMQNHIRKIFRQTKVTQSRQKKALWIGHTSLPISGKY